MARLPQTAGLSDVQSEILATVRQFVDKEVIPHAQELEHADTYPADIVAGMKEMGLFGITIPEEYGGINPHFIVAHMISRHGTEAQKQHFLPRMATGEVRGSFSMSEPDLGSDVAAIKTKAKRDGDEYVIDGAKMWLTNGGAA